MNHMGAQLSDDRRCRRGNWDGNRYDADSVTGDLTSSLSISYDSNNVYVRVDVEDGESVSDKAVEIYHAAKCSQFQRG